MKGIKRWKALPTEAVVDPSLKVFKASFSEPEPDLDDDTPAHRAWTRWCGG